MPSATLDTVDAEVALFRAIVKHRPVGSSRHFAMLSVCHSLQEDLGRTVAPEEVWGALHGVYDLKTLDEIDDADSDVLGLGATEEAAEDRWSEFQLPIHPAIPADESFLSLVNERRLRGEDDPVSPEASSPARSVPSASKRTRSVRSVSTGATRDKDGGEAGGEDSDLTEQEEDGDEEGETSGRRTRSRPSTGGRGRGRGRAKARGRKRK